MKAASLTFLSLCLYVLLLTGWTAASAVAAATADQSNAHHDDASHAGSAHAGSAHAGSAHAETQGGLPQFDPEWFASQIFWLAVFFALLYLLFSRRVLPEISSVIENRRNHIQADLDQAEKLRAEAQSAAEAYDASLEKARGEASALIGQTENTIRQRVTDEQDAFRTRLEGEIRDTESRLSQAKQQALEEMADVAAGVAASAVQKITGLSPDPAQAENVVHSLTGKAKAA